MPVLRGRRVTLIPLAEVDRDALFEACRPEEVWRLMPMPLGRNRAIFDDYVEAALQQERDGTSLPFAILDGERVVGSTRICALEPAHRKGEVGYTWHHPSVWRTHVNTESKRLILGHAFETLELIRVFFNVDERNTRSQAAVLRLGAVREGLLRHDRILHDGFRRNTVVFSLLAEEWPAARARLDEAIGAD